jgi:post-segregation antitoxin (ccd killing protein)
MTGAPVFQEDQPLNLSSTGMMKGLNRKKPAQAIRIQSSRLTVSLSKDLVDRLRDTVYWIRQLTLSHLVEEAISTSLAQLESANQGRFPKRTEELKPGRPRSVRHAQRIVAPSQTHAPIRQLDTGMAIHSSPEQGHGGHLGIDSVLR